MTINNIIFQMRNLGQSGSIDMAKLNRLKTQADNALIIYSNYDKNSLTQQVNNAYSEGKQRISLNIARKSGVGKSFGESIVPPIVAQPLEEVVRSYRVLRDITLSNFVPQGSRMAQRNRTFKKGGILKGVNRCSGADGGYILVKHGMTYHFGCGKNSALREIIPEAQDMIPDPNDDPRYNPNTPELETMDDGTTPDDTRRQDVIEEQGFFQKNKTILIVVGVLAAAGAGYYFWKKKK